MSKIITRGGICSTRNKPMGFQFVDEGGRYELGGSYGSSGGNVVAGTDALPDTLYLSDGYKGCKLCGNKYSYICPACNAVVCCDGKEKRGAHCPSCGSTLDISAVSGKTLPKATVVSRAAFKVNGGDRVDNGPYTKWAGVSRIEGAAIDRFGNAQGSQYDLARDGAFNGYTVIVINLCNECDFSLPRNALNKKGFVIKEYKTTPEASSLEKILAIENSQLWIISDRYSKHNLKFNFSRENKYFSNVALGLIKDYFFNGHGVYIWADNDPWFEDANILLNTFFDKKRYGKVFLYGYDMGMKVLSLQEGNKQSGIIENHPISTGLENFYEGNTISIVEPGTALKPLVYNSDNHLLVAYYDDNERHLLVDGGFTRLWVDWDSAGTDRYVVNAAAWLANIEKFGYHPQK